MSVLTFNLSRSSIAPGWDPEVAPHDALWQEFAAGYLYRLIATPAILHDSLRSTDPATRGRSDTFDSSAGSLDLAAPNFAGDVGLDWSGDGQAATLRLDSAWNSIANVFVSEFTGASLTVANWVDVAISLPGQLAREISVDGAKRAEIVAGSGADIVFVGHDSDGTADTNLIRIKTGSGNDSITVGTATLDYSGTFSGALYRPFWSRAEILAGPGNDTINGGPGADRINGGDGFDTAVFDGPRSAYSVTVAGDVVTVRDLRAPNARLDGTDRLRLVEFLAFSDETQALPQPGFGAVSPPFLLGDALTGASPLFVTSTVDYGADHYDASDFGELNPGAQTLLSGTPPQRLSEALSLDVLARVVGAQLLKAAAGIGYDASGPEVEYLVAIDGVRIGVEVTRAFTFPLGSPYTFTQATAALTDKLEDIAESTANVASADRWQKAILHVLSPDAATTETLSLAHAALDAALRGDTIVIVTQTQGDDAFLFS